MRPGPDKPLLDRQAGLLRPAVGLKLRQPQERPNQDLDEWAAMRKRGVLLSATDQSAPAIFVDITDL